LYTCCVCQLFILKKLDDDDDPRVGDANVSVTEAGMAGWAWWSWSIHA